MKPLDISLGSFRMRNVLDKYFIVQLMHSIVQIVGLLKAH